MNKADLTNKEDLSFAIMNLISIEEHLAMTSVKAKKEEYLHILIVYFCPDKLLPICNILHLIQEKPYFFVFVVWI